MRALAVGCEVGRKSAAHSAVAIWRETTADAARSPMRRRKALRFSALPRWPQRHKSEWNTQWRWGPEDPRNMTAASGRAGSGPPPRNMDRLGQSRIIPGMVKLGSRDKKVSLLIAGEELTELKRFTWLMSDAFGLDTRFERYQGKRPIGLYSWDIECLLGRHRTCPERRHGIS